ncbi:hypothetical protein OK016_29035 [Vibrio chagasii]|nr:hypothetical protein [Vibrio chagasii]
MIVSYRRKTLYRLYRGELNYHSLFGYVETATLKALYLLISH